MLVSPAWRPKLAKEPVEEATGPEDTVHRRPRWWWGCWVDLKRTGIAYEQLRSPCALKMNNKISG